MIIINYIIGRWKSLTYACQGIWWLLKTESQFKFHFGLAFLTCILGISYNISNTEWLVQTLIISFILSAEALNTAVEKLADFVEPKHNKSIGRIKDMGAAGVFIGVIAAIVIALIIYIPKIFQ